MGSGNTRKRSDTANPSTIIKNNKNNKKENPIENGGEVKALNESCPLSERIKLENSIFRNGQQIYLALIENIVSIYMGSTKIQDVKGKKGTKLAFCLEKGFRYQGEVKNGYGLFQRAT